MMIIYCIAIFHVTLIYGEKICVGLCLKIEFMGNLCVLGPLVEGGVIIKLLLLDLVLYWDFYLFYHKHKMM